MLSGEMGGKAFAAQFTTTSAPTLIDTLASSPTSNTGGAVKMNTPSVTILIETDKRGNKNRAKFPMVAICCHRKRI